jgi:hypothetical protein
VRAVLSLVAAICIRLLALSATDPCAFCHSRNSESIEGGDGGSIDLKNEVGAKVRAGAFVLACNAGWQHNCSVCVRIVTVTRHVSRDLNPRADLNW